MRLNDLAPTTFSLELITPAGTKTGVFVELVGMDSKPFVDGIKKTQAAAQNADAAGKKLSTDQKQRLSAETLAGCIVGWTGLSDEDGNPLPHSYDKALEILLDPRFTWINQAVDGAIETRQNFFRPNEIKAV